MIDKTYISNMKHQLDIIKNSLIRFIKKQTLVETKADSIAGLLTITPRYSFSLDLNIQLKNQQISLMNQFKQWEEHFLLILEVMPLQFRKEVNNILNFIQSRIELKHDWLIEKTIKANVTYINKNISFLFEIFNILEENKKGYMLVLDADILVSLEGGLSSVKEKVGFKDFELVLLPSVLDEIKKIINSQFPKHIRENGEKIIAEIRELKKQGTLFEGVKFRDYMIIVPPKESDFSNTLNWLDQSSLEDRIIAAVLAFEHTHHDKIVVLVTENINLQNKAEMASLPVIEPLV